MPRLKSPKAKGDDYERELAEFFNAHLLKHVHRLDDFRRALLSGGGVSEGGFDLSGTGIQVGGVDFELGIEAKRCEKINVREAMSQALQHMIAMGRRGACVERVLPMVVTRRNHQATADSLVVMPLWALVQLIRGG
jgi:hypothetical protein